MDHKAEAQSINDFFNPHFVHAYLKKHAPGFARDHDLSGLTVAPIKKHVDSGFFHVVLRYDAPSLGEKPIYCTAHSREPRKSAFEALTYIKTYSQWKPNIEMAEPLHYDERWNMFIYRGIEGENLLFYLSDPHYDMRTCMRRTAQWLATLHETSIIDAKNFNPQNSRIRTTIPGPDYFLEKIKRLFPEFEPEVKKLFYALVEKEETQLAHLERLYLIHGDVHPENIIVNTKAGISVSLIDFTDFCIADWARDIGSLIQQIGFMARGKRDPESIAAAQRFFLTRYFTERKTSITSHARKRVVLYQAWTALRSTIYFLVKDPAEPENARTELSEARIHFKML